MKKKKKRPHRKEFPSFQSEPLNSKCFSRFLCYFLSFLEFKFDLKGVERPSTGTQ